MIDLRCYIYFLIRDSEISTRCVQALSKLKESEVGQYRCLFYTAVVKAWSEIYDRIESGDHYKVEALHIVVSDDILAGDSMSLAALQLRARYSQESVAMVAVGAKVARRYDRVDCALGQSATSDELHQSVIEVVRSLVYRRKPSKVRSSVRVELRMISTVSELRESFALRYQVFSLLNYIPDQFNSTTTRLELDNFDKYSIPFGCFVAGRGGELVGLVRLITQQFQKTYADMTWKVLEGMKDAILRRSYDSPYYQELPVFESLPLEELQEKWHRASQSYCELSRVIVREEFRGQGISALLIQHALTVARKKGIRICVLACVPNQMEMYAKVGFKALEKDIVLFRRIDQPARAMYLDLLESTEGKLP